MSSDDLVAFGIINELMKTIKQFNETIQKQMDMIQKQGEMIQNQSQIINSYEERFGKLEGKLNHDDNANIANRDFTT